MKFSMAKFGQHRPPKLTIRQVEKILAQYTWGSALAVMRTKRGFALHYRMSIAVIGCLAITDLCELAEVFHPLRAYVTTESSGDYAEDQEHHLVVLLVDESEPEATQPIKGRKVNKLDRRGSKHDKRQAKRRISDKAKARLKR
jgi:hypothetical protein